MYQFTESQIDLALKVFSSVENIVAFVAEFKEVQRKKCELDKLGASMFSGRVSYYNSDEYFEQCTIYLNIAKFCADAQNVRNEDELCALSELDFELDLFKNNMNDLGGVLEMLGRYSRADAQTRGMMLHSLVRVIATSGHLINESESLLYFLSVCVTPLCDTKAVAKEYEMVKDLCNKDMA